jgi:mono/diheme cytochrome c family protein
MILAATNTARSVGYVIAAVAVLGFLTYAFAVYRKARAETGSEIELAPNRKPYYEDDELETKKLDRSLGMGLGLLVVIAVALPAYWLTLPGRQEGWAETWDRTFISRGEESYDALCSACHGPGGVGGVAPHPLTNPDGSFLEQVEWNAPALNTVLNRYSKSEVEFVLTYGRGNTPMPPWGADGGGPLTTQQIQEIIAYLESIQLDAPEMRAEVQGGLVDRFVNGRVEQETEAAGPDGLPEAEALALEEALTTEVEGRLAEGTYDYNFDGAWSRVELGEAMFNLEVASGAYSCARCHTKGWSYGQPEVSGGGSLGWNLTGGETLRQFPTFEEHVAFVTEGSERGQAFGQGGVSGAGQMPGFGFNPNANDEGSTLTPEQFLYTQEQIEAVVAYERSL